MARELQKDAIVDCFENEIKDSNYFIDSELREIKSHLKILTKPNTKRYEKIESAMFLWKKVMKKSISNLTDNLRGVDNLFRYYDKFTKYESLLFALDDNHRDHIIHSIWVMLIGIYVKKHFPIHNDYYNIGVLDNSYKESDLYKKAVELTEKHEMDRWFLISLTHDLGYPIEKTLKANKIMTDMISNFGFLELREFKYDFTIVHQTAIDELLNILALIQIMESESGFTNCESRGTRIDFAKSFERLGHGIMSAYLLFTSLDFVSSLCGIRGLRLSYVSDPERVSLRFIISSWLKAISAHTFVYRYWDSLDDDESFLFIVDEIDEFSRYSRSKTTQEWLDVGCRTGLNLTATSLEIKYTFENTEIEDDISRFFNSKVSKFMDRFDVNGNIIKSLKIVCEDIRLDKPQTYKYYKHYKTYPNGIMTLGDGSTYENEDIYNYIKAQLES